MEYLSTKQVALNWAISQRLVIRLCNERKIPAIKKNGKWGISENVTKPEDKRIKTGEFVKEKSLLPFLNNVIEGDCLDVMKRFPSKSIDMILCDLPYGYTQNKWDSLIPLNKLWREYSRILKKNGVVVLTSAGLFTAQIMLSNPQMFKYKIVWIKSKATNFLNVHRQPLRKYEDICVFYKDQPIYNPQMSEGQAYDKGVRKAQLTGSYGDFSPNRVKSDGKRYPTDVVYFKTAESEGDVIHPTQKPIELGSYLIKTYTDEGAIVLDNCSGSGSFLISAMLQGRNFIGIELNKETQLFKKKRIDYVLESKKRILAYAQKMEKEKLSPLEKINLLEGI